MSELLIPQQFIGRVNVVGDCYCMGVVVERRPPTYKNIPIYLSLVGPATSVEAAWAKLSQGKETSVVPETGNAIYLEPNKAGLFQRYQKKLDALGVDHLVLVHEHMAEPLYPLPGDKEPFTTYMLCVSEEQKLAKLGEHVRKTVKIAVFDAWFPYLLVEGRRMGLLSACNGYGVEALAITLDAQRWTTIITGGLKDKKISLSV
jgi:hypothetical protein